MTDALAGIRVVDFTTTIAGPHCTRMMADLGADVIKIESPEGDLMRSRPPLRNGASALFAHLNAGKKSVVLDLKKPAASDAARRLAATADIVVENYRPGVTRRLGIDYGTLKALKPDLIYCAISGYGQDGPGADRPAYAPVVHAATGYDLAHLTYQQDKREKPDFNGIFVADFMAGAYAFGGIMAALAQKRATGVGQMVDLAMYDAMLGLLMSEFQRAQFPIELPSRPMYGPVKAKGGYIIIATASERTFGDLARAAGHPEWLEDPRFAKYSDRRENWGQFMDLFEGWSGTVPINELISILEKHSVPCSPYRTVKEALEDPQAKHRGIMEMVRDKGGLCGVPNPPFRLSASDTRARDFTAALGEHTQAVLRAVGLSDAEIAAVG
ncbi:CaiB/BaiF CoA-transferase family protein [Reyranella sp. CPCC 100927]|uniref:CaiB/BaiF CoA transferase family protein n=1 Tax=Reyranella sp. CPCC 100927 TaxID=2599616 RepID=UPI0011B7ACE1|nr:CoA transferase [Reyranella sp. CPCC 100927]TWS98467.1 CoA transferase [Reyranella sp. CPCC 100927]